MDAVLSWEDLDGRIGRLATDHFDLVFRKFLSGDQVVFSKDSLRLVTGEMNPLGNMAVVRAGTDGATLREAAEPLTGLAVPSAVLLMDEASGEAESVLAELGFGPAGAMPAMAVEIGSLADCALPEGYTFREVDGSDEESWVSAFAEGYELPRRLAALFGPVLGDGDDSVSFFAVERDGRIVATSLVVRAEGVAGVYCVSTVPDERRKGLGAFVTAEALRRSADLGYRVGVLQASEPGYPVYRALGFVDVGVIPLFVRMPG